MITVISGGQTGVDQAALEAAAAVGLSTGGFMPAGYRTQSGPRPDIAKRFGLTSLASPYYPPRTEANVRASDITILFGNVDSRGCRLTTRYCEKHDKQTIEVRWPFWPQITYLDHIEPALESLVDPAIQTINVAGNREEVNPGISAAAYEFLYTLFFDLKKRRSEYASSP